MSEVSMLRKELNKKIEQRTHCLRTIALEKERLAKYQQHEADVLIAQETLQKLAQMIQQRSHQQIAKIVSRCLEAVFENPYQLKIDFVRLRGKTEARLHYLRDGQEVDPLRTSGGVLDVSSLGLRLTQIKLGQPPVRQFLALDEPFKAVSAKNLPKVAALMQSLAKDMGIQIVCVTHNPNLEIGTVYEL